MLIFVCQFQVTGLENDVHFTKFSTTIDTLLQSNQTVADSFEQATELLAKQVVKANESNEIEEQKKVCPFFSIRHLAHIH